MVELTENSRIREERDFRSMVGEVSLIIVNDDGGDILQVNFVAGSLVVVAVSFFCERKREIGLSRTSDSGLYCVLSSGLRSNSYGIIGVFK